MMNTERPYPEDGDEYYYIDFEAEDVRRSSWHGNLRDEFAFSIGNVHKTPGAALTYIDMIHKVISNNIVLPENFNDRQEVRWQWYRLHFIQLTKHDLIAIQLPWSQ